MKRGEKGSKDERTLYNMALAEEPWKRARAAIPPDAERCGIVTKESMAETYGKVVNPTNTYSRQVPDNIVEYGAYLRGFTAAVLELQETFQDACEDLRHHHRGLTARAADGIFQCFLENRHEILEGKTDGFIRWNEGKAAFEFFRPGKDSRARKTIVSPSENGGS